MQMDISPKGRKNCWLFLGLQNWIAWIHGPIWPDECCTVVLPAENEGAGNRKSKECMFFCAFLYGILFENCQHHRSRTTVYVLLEVLWFQQQAQKKQRTHGQSSHWNPCARFWTEGAAEWIPCSLAPQRQLFIQLSRSRVSFVTGFKARAYLYQLPQIRVLG